MHLYADDDAARWRRDDPHWGRGGVGQQEQTGSTRSGQHACVYHKTFDIGNVAIEERWTICNSYDVLTKAPGQHSEN